MAASPKFKVYNARDQYMAACKEPEAAAVLVSFYGVGSRIRYGHLWVLWTEGDEPIPAAESYDTVARIVHQRLADLQDEAFHKVYGRGEVIAPD